jgi:outer membrane protein OmpA-like peptidoglycan-associated protein
MSMKFKLFASVAAPVLSLPLIIQPASALSPGLAFSPVQTNSGIVQVQQEVLPEGGQEGGAPAEAPVEEAPAEAPAAEAPAEEAPAEQPPVEEEAPAQESQGGGEASQPEASEEAPAQEAPSQEAEPQAEQPREEAPAEQEQPAESEQPQQEPQGEQPSQGSGEQESAPSSSGEGQSQGEGGQQQEGQSGGGSDSQGSDNQDAPSQAPAAEGQDGNAPAAGETAPDGATQGQDGQSGEGQSDQSNDGQSGQSGEGQSGDSQSGQSGEGESGQAPQQQPDRQQSSQDGAPQGEAPAGAADGQAPAGQPADPAQAGNGGTGQAPAQQAGEQQMLPVENGAAILDSAKEQRPDRGQRDGQRDGQRPQQGGQPAQQADQQPAPRPTTDADAQAQMRAVEDLQEEVRALREEQGERLDRRPDFDRPRGWDVRGPARGERGRDRDRDRDDDRVIISIDNQTFVRHNDSRRFYVDGREPEYERLDGGRYREVVERDDGTRVITIRNRYGEVVRRTRIVDGGEEYVLYYAPELMEDRRDYVWRDPGDDLPPMRLTVPIDDYIIDTSSDPDRDYYEFLEQPPVERVERVYSLDEVRYSARIRDKVPRIDLDTVTFATGSAEIPMNQARSLRRVADAINKVLKDDPSETFLIEGHTDAVGSDDSNLVLSDERAESVAIVLTDAFGIPPENLTTQGYGERYLKVNTESANQENRRVTVRRITPLVKPVASNQ